MLCCGLLLVDFIHIFQGYFTGTGAIIWLPQWQWSNPIGYGYMDQMSDETDIITTIKQGRLKLCTFLFDILYIIDLLPKHCLHVDIIFIFDHIEPHSYLTGEWVDSDSMWWKSYWRIFCMIQASTIWAICILGYNMKYGDISMFPKKKKKSAHKINVWPALLCFFSGESVWVWMKAHKYW